MTDDTNTPDATEGTTTDPQRYAIDAATQEGTVLQCIAHALLDIRDALHDLGKQQSYGS